AVVVEVEAAHHDNFVEIEFAVTDSGIGIPKENLRSIFSNFTQVDSSRSRKYGGSGLGLAIAKRLVDLMHGKITVTSTPGSGTCFKVIAPFQLPSDAPASVELRELAGQRVLVIDDNRINRLLARETLMQAHARVSESSTHETAIAAIRKAVVMN